jgi:F0F1-type ATP synthase delta subunit
MAAKSTELQLPTTIVTQLELNRLVREADLIDDSLRQAGLRTGGEATTLPKASQLLNDLVTSNNLNLLHEPDRKLVREILEYLQKQGPVLHMSFSVDPSPVFLRDLIVWMRAELHPHIFLQIGLQPSIGAGCIVRTNNKYFDLSLREHFQQQRQLLITKLHEAAGQPAKEQHEQPA